MDKFKSIIIITSMLVISVFALLLIFPEYLNKLDEFFFRFFGITMILHFFHYRNGKKRQRKIELDKLNGL